MKTKIILVLVSIFLVFNISFSASKVRTRKRTVASSNIKQKIVNTQWKLVKISDDDVSKKGITLNISKDELSGKSGVNNYFGGYKVNGKKISVSKLAVTAMAGSTEKMDLEQDYLDILENVKRIELQNDKLIMKTDLGEILTFTREKNFIPY